MRGAAVYPVEVDGQLFDLMERFWRAQGPQDRRPAGCRHGSRQVAAPRAGGVAAGRGCFPALVARGVTHKRGHWPNMSTLEANRTRRDSGNGVNDPRETSQAEIWS